MNIKTIKSIIKLIQSSQGEGGHIKSAINAAKFKVTTTSSIALGGALALTVAIAGALFRKGVYELYHMASNKISMNRKCALLLEKMQSLEAPVIASLYDENQAYCNTDHFRSSTSELINLKVVKSRDQGGDYETALQLYLKSISIRRPSAGSTNLMNAGTVLSRLERNNEAIDYFDKFISLNPRYPEGYARRGIAYSLLGDFGSACRDIRKAQHMGLNTFGSNESIDKWIKLNCIQ